jgi:S1-C subfamily serine protease
MKNYLLILFTLIVGDVHAETLPQLIAKVKPSVVAIAIYSPTAAPRLKLMGTGFVIVPGNQVVTNNHVISSLPDESKNERYVVLSGHGQNPVVHAIISKKSDVIHDLAVLNIAATLPALQLANSDDTPEGTALAFTGYPITGVLGLYPATHQATLSAITPIAIPQDNSKALSAATLRKLRQPFMVYQLDGTAYPGNSGSALYRKNDGVVIAIINMVLVKSSREAVLSDPSGIAYAIPVKHLHQLLAQP